MLLQNDFPLQSGKPIYFTANFLVTYSEVQRVATKLATSTE